MYYLSFMKQQILNLLFYRAAFIANTWNVTSLFTFIPT